MQFLSQHPQLAKKCIQSLKNRYFCYFPQFLVRGFRQNLKLKMGLKVKNSLFPFPITTYALILYTE